MTDDLSNIFEEADKYINRAIYRWKSHFPYMWEDAHQEGMIQVWRDVEAGETVKLKILRRASMVANKYFHRNGEYSFGKPKKSRDGLRSNTKNIEKVKAYLDEVMPLRNHVWPTAKEASEALGLEYQSVRKILKSIKEGDMDHMVYREDGRMDWDYYKTVSVENYVGRLGDSESHWADNPVFTDYTETFEDSLVSDMDVDNLLSQLSEHHAQVLTWYLKEAMSGADIGRKLGYAKSPSQHGDKHLKAALNQASIILYPYRGECNSGHTRNAENTKVVSKVGGGYQRVCIDCRTKTGRLTAQKQRETGFRTGRKPVYDCPHGHGPKTYRDARGTMRCVTCKNEQARKSAQKKAAQKRENS